MTEHFMRQGLQAQTEIPAIAPFDLQQTIAALRRRPNQLAEAMVDGEYRRIVSIDDREHLIGVRQIVPDFVAIRALDAPLTPTELGAAASVVKRMLGLDVDMAPLRAALAFDARLLQLARQIAGMKPPRFDTLWHTFLCIVPFQQVSVDAGTSMLNRLIARFGIRIEHDNHIYYGFPSPESIHHASYDELRSCGLSQTKIRTLQYLAVQITDGAISEGEIDALNDVEAVARLIQLPGIGVWSAQLILLRGFRRLSFFPPGDSGAARGLRSLFDLPAEQVDNTLVPILERLGQWRGYLYYMILAHKLLQSHTITPYGE
ncbi:MAG: DNA-3-methyladenine glycosylase family protein [Ktedonobacterales bacterium]